MFTVTQIKEHQNGMGHGGTLNKVRNVEAMFERSASRFLLKVHPLESVRSAALSNPVWDDVYNYALPADFGELIDLIPQDNRQLWDVAFRNPAGQFDVQKAVRNRTVSIEGSEGSKALRINWRSRAGKVLNNMDSLTANGTWGAVGSATGLAADTIFKVSGNASIKFNLVVTGDGIQNTTMNTVDLTSENGVSNVFVWIYFPSAPTSVNIVWGNDLTTKYWTGVAQTTQADGTAFKVGWNLLSWSWAAATQTGTVAPATIKAFKLTVVAGAAISSLRVDSILFAIGRNFDIKYYSKYLFRSSAGVWLSRTADDSDSVVLDNDTLPLFLMECLIDMAQQMEGTDSAFDIKFAETQLATLYPIYKGINPSMIKKTIQQYGTGPKYGVPLSRRWSR